MRILCSTGTFIGRVNGRNHMLIPELGGSIDCDGFELMVYGDWYPFIEKVIADIRGFSFVTLHTDKAIGELLGSDKAEECSEALDVFELNCHIAKSVGCEIVVLHLWSVPHVDYHIERNVSNIPRLCEIAAAYGVTLSIEGTPCVAHDPVFHLSNIHKQFPHVGFTLDSRHLAFHGLIDGIADADFLSAVNHIHISELAGKPGDFASLRPILHPREGDIDFAKFARDTSSCGAKQLTLESPAFTPNGLDICKVNKSLNYMRELYDSVK